VAKPPNVDDRTQEDELLAIRCQLGERAAFDDLIRRWNDPLWRYVRRLAGSDESASDILQDAWLRVLRGIPRLRQPAKLRPWLFGIARRAAMDRLRDQYARPADTNVDMADLPASESTDAIEEDLAAMHQELSRLPLIEREVLTLFYLKDLSLDDVGDVLDVPVGTVKSRLFRARHLLRRELTLKGVRP
jgi:RNA polymerase sigma-70 factor (ECF subfamily)